MSNTYFPYNQTVAAFSPVIGGNSGTTIVVGAYSSGFSLCQIQPNGLSSSNELQFTWNCIGNIQNSGSSTTAMTFLTNGQNQANNTQYLLAGSEAGDLYLYAVEIAQNASALTASNLSSSTKIASFDSAVASICYDPQATTSNNLFIALANGDIYAYSVTFNNSFTTSLGSMTNLLYCNGYSLVMSPTGSLVLYSPGYTQVWYSAPYSQWNSQFVNTGTFWTGVQNYDLSVMMSDLLSTVAFTTLWKGNTYTPTAALALGNNGTVFVIDTANNATLDILSQGSGSMTAWAVLDGYLTNLSPQQCGSSFTAPTLTQTAKNTSLSSASGGQVQIVPLAQGGGPLGYLITGISGAGLYLYSGGLNTALSNVPSPTVAIATNGSTVYVATENALYEGTWNSGSWGFGGFTQLWPTSGQTISKTITSLSFSNCQDTIYTQGALYIGTFANNDSGDSGTGSLYAYNPATGTTQVINSDGIPGATWSVLGDVAGYVLINSGSTGLAIANPCPSAQLETEYFQMIDNQGSSTKKPDGIAALITAVLAMAFSIATFNPEALAVSITGVVLATAGLGEAGAATGEAITGNNAPSGIPTSNSGSD
ncbi:hypothetical protein PN502_16900 [Microcystis aeruginosa CS-338/01]|uniref:hypothetical protein n=1 Tax=Microcystis aeruginosa TaxID=1126 RepID=UPI00232B7937|nr:hypothetical protein [Microcystis aeruginosa]MDB9508709.1 hypothetical protein [Microcystis aeruginosa CS-338/01]